MATSDSSYLMFVGTYTDFDILAHLPHNENAGKGIYPFHFHNGQLTSLPVIPALNPAVMCFHPKYHNILYSITEGIKNDGYIECLELDIKIKCNNNNTINKLQQLQDDKEEELKEGENKELETNNDIKIEIKCDKKQQIECKGKSTCYFAIHPYSYEHGISINYWNGSLDIYEMNKNDGLFKKHIHHIQHCDNELNNGKLRQVINREDHWKNRMVGPHAHSVHFYNKLNELSISPWVFVPDLGTNSIFQYSYDDENLLSYDGEIMLDEGCGPRHMVWHPTLKTAYISNELGSSVTVLEINDNDIKKKKNYV